MISAFLGRYTGVIPRSPKKAVSNGLPDLIVFHTMIERSRLSIDAPFPAYLLPPVYFSPLSFFLIR